MTTRNPQNIMIIDDELLIADDLKHVLESGGHRVVNTSYSCQEAAAALNETPPDLVICDVFFNRRPEGIAFCRDHLDGKLPYFLISGQSADRVLGLSEQIAPLGLIFKPFRDEDILTRIELSLKRGSDRKESPRFLTVRFGGRNHIVNQADILYIESDGNYCTIKSRERTYSVLSSLQALMDQLDERHFFQVHRSYLVNLREVHSFSASKLILNGKLVIPIGRSYRNDFLRHLRNRFGN